MSRFSIQCAAVLSRALQRARAGTHWRWHWRFKRRWLRMLIAPASTISSRTARSAERASSVLSVKFIRQTRSTLHMLNLNTLNWEHKQGGHPERSVPQRSRRTCISVARFLNELPRRYSSGSPKKSSRGLEQRLIVADYSLRSIHGWAEVRDFHADPGPECRIPVQSPIRQQSEYAQIQDANGVLRTDQAGLSLSPCKKGTVDCNDLRFIGHKN